MERKAEEATAKLSASILARYHEEQIWSDKIRRMSTWGTWGLMGVNVLLFLVFQIGVEPWRRKRLVKGFEEKVMEALEREGTAAGVAFAAAQGGSVGTQDKASQTGEIPATQGFHSQTVQAIDEVVPEVSTEEVMEADETVVISSGPAPRPTKYEEYKEAFRDLFSDREVSLRRIDLTTVAFEGAAAGMALMGIIVLLLRPK